MPSIVEQIQKDALDPNFPVSALLRKVKLAATKLKLPKVEDWVDSELKGYKGEVPDYRKIRGQPKAKNPYVGWIPIAGTGEVMKMISIVPLGQPISGIESLLAAKDRGEFIFPYPPNIVEMLNQDNDVYFAEMGAHFDRSAAVAVVDAVRTLVLEWAIELEKRGIAGTEVSFSKDEQKLAQQAGVSIQIGSIHSFTGNLGSSGVSGDVVTTHISADTVRDVVSQVKQQSEQLVREGVDSAELQNCLKVIEAALDAKKSASVVSQLLKELRDVVRKAGAKLVSVGVVTLLNQLLGTGVPIAQ
jgi:hypothetical protein